jgi:uncharacterized oxidoreductase
MAFLLDPSAFCGTEFYGSEIEALGRFVKSSKLMSGFDEILLPGEPEAREAGRRKAEGIPIDAITWKKICDIAAAREVAIPQGT